MLIFNKILSIFIKNQNILIKWNFIKNVILLLFIMKFYFIFT